MEDIDSVGHDGVSIVGCDRVSRSFRAARSDALNAHLCTKSVR